MNGGFKIARYVILGLCLGTITSAESNWRTRDRGGSIGTPPERLTRLERPDVESRLVNLGFMPEEPRSSKSWVMKEGVSEQPGKTRTEAGNCRDKFDRDEMGKYERTVDDMLARALESQSRLDESANGSSRSERFRRAKDTKWLASTSDVRERVRAESSRKEPKRSAHPLAKQPSSKKDGLDKLLAKQHKRIYKHPARALLSQPQTKMPKVEPQPRQAEILAEKHGKTVVQSRIAPAHEYQAPRASKKPRTSVAKKEKLVRNKHNQVPKGSLLNPKLVQH